MKKKPRRSARRKKKLVVRVSVQTFNFLVTVIITA